eukprot:TRINITY_DN65512_c0_g1_i1.p1 TRINITY_DN65512_c0_g1~~TRINITY_DN65512_c0_g1_i1.p1  ORF type:complete len:1150 (-),score=211.32 TRINITY_DN65512_c0_g1_i1:232-3681(-)
MSAATSDAEGSGADGAQAAPKRPRVSFSRVETRTFESGAQEAPFCMSSPATRSLSPASLTSDDKENRHLQQDGDAHMVDSQCPSVAKLCETPDSIKARRDSHDAEIQQDVQTSGVAPGEGEVEGGKRQRALASSGLPLAEAGDGNGGDVASRRRSLGEDSMAISYTGSVEGLGDLTGEVPSLAGLVDRDEADGAIPPGPRSSLPPGTPKREAGVERCPVPSPTPAEAATPMSEAEDWDLYGNYKKTGGRTSYGRPRLSGLGAGRVGRGSQRDVLDSFEHSVDMSTLIRCGRPFNGVRHDLEGSEVPEGRNSFASILPDTGTSAQRHETFGRRASFPGSSRFGFAAAAEAATAASPPVGDRSLVWKTIEQPRRQPRHTQPLPGAYQHDQSRQLLPLEQRQPHSLEEQKRQQEPLEHQQQLPQQPRQQHAQRLELRQQQEPSLQQSQSAQRYQAPLPMDVQSEERRHEHRKQDQQLAQGACTRATASQPSASPEGKGCESEPFSFLRRASLQRSARESVESVLPPLFKSDVNPDDLDFMRVNKEFEERVASKRCGLAPAGSAANGRRVSLNGHADVMHVESSNVFAEEATGEASLHYSELSGELELLPGDSSLHYLPRVPPLPGSAGAATSERPPSSHMSWDEFLRSVAITFPGQKGEEAEPPVIGKGMGTRGTRQTVDLLTQLRARCLQEAVQRLSNRSQEVMHAYEAKVANWNQSRAPPQAAADLAAAKNDPMQMQTVHEGKKAWKLSCADDAWLHWYGLKKEWQDKDFSLAQQHAAALQQDLGRLKDNTRRLEQVLSSIQSVTRDGRDLADLRRSGRQLNEVGADALKAARMDQVFMERKSSELRAAAHAQDRELAELMERVARARAAYESEKNDAQAAKRSCLQKQALRVRLEMQRYAQTCVVKSANPNCVGLQLRGGAQLQVQQAASGMSKNLVRVTLSMDDNAEDESSDAVLRVELFRYAWQRAVKAVSIEDGSSGAAPLEASMSYEKLSLFLCRLNVAALHVADVLRSLAEARKCPRMTSLDARLGDTPHGRRLCLSASYLLLRSHEVDRWGYLAPLDSRADPAHVDATRCTFEFDADVERFPAPSSFARLQVRRAPPSRHRDGFLEEVASKAVAAAAAAVGGGLQGTLRGVAEALHQGAWGLP